ncbi:MAG: hypothetical protein ACRD5G_05540, partial [Candidatus Acidiferrales bacterium]
SRSARHFNATVGQASRPVRPFCSTNVPNFAGQKNFEPFRFSLFAFRFSPFLFPFSFLLLLFAFSFCYHLSALHQP